MQNPTATIREQQAKVMGNSPTDTLRNASITDDKKKKEIKKKAIQGATKGKKDTNVDVAKLNTPEEVLDQYKDTQRLFAQEGVIPVKENMSEENQMIIIKRLRDEGYSDTAVSAIMGNIDVETGGSFSHTQQQEGGKGYGILQLDFQRPYYDTYLKDNNKEDSLNSQLDYFIDQINTGSVIGAGNAEQLRNIFGDPNASVEDMTTMLVDRFFKPGKPNLDRRIESAKMRLENMKTKPFPAARAPVQLEFMQEKPFPATRAPVQEETPEQVPQMADGGLTENDDDTLGATEKEVADDIPAQISEGELVVPANVVRYHGLSTYESLRQSALLGLKGLENEGQLKKVDENGIPVEEDKKEDKEKDTIKVQTVKMLSAKEGGFPDLSGDGKVTRKDVLLGRGVDLKEGGFPDLSGDGKVTQKDILMGRGVDLQEGGSLEKDDDEKVIGRPVDPVGPRITPREGQTITPDDSGNKATLRTPEGKNYRVTDPNLKITAQGPRTQNIVGGDYTGDPNLPGFGVDKGTGGGDKKDLGDTIIDELTPYAKAGLTIGALDLLFNQGKITSQAFNWARQNIFTGEVFNPDNWQMFKDGKLAVKYLGPSGGAGAGVSAGAGTLTETAKNIAAGQSITSQIEIIGEGANTIYKFNGVEYTSMEEALSAGETLKESLAASDTVTTGADAVTTGSQGVWNWKTGFAAVGAGLSLYDIIENGPSVANVAGLGYSTGVLAQGGVLGAGAKAATTGTALGSAVTVLGFVALAAGLVQLFSGPPSNKVGEAAYNFDNPEYNPDDILSGGFWTEKRSDENINGAKSIVASVGSYVNSLEESLDINIGGELFIDVGNREGLRYGYVEGYDELGMYKYHKKDLDYKLLHGPGQVGKGFTGEDSVTQLMDKINDDVNVLTMFALADKAAGGEGYATFDKIGEYRDKINVLTTYKPAMSGSNSQAVLTEQERNILQGFQQKEFARVTGEELATVLTLYDKIKPVHNQNQYQGFSYQGM